MHTGWNPPAFPTAPAGNSTKQPASTEFVTQAIGSAALSSFTDFVSGVVSAPTNIDYRIIESLPFAITVVSFVAKTSTGTISAAVYINTTVITNGSLSVTSTQTSIVPTALNTAAVGSTISLVCAAATSPANLSFTVAYTRSP